jgi:hypothetical protein
MYPSYGYYPTRRGRPRVGLDQLIGRDQLIAGFEELVGAASDPAVAALLGQRGMAQPDLLPLNLANIQQYVQQHAPDILPLNLNSIQQYVAANQAQQAHAQAIDDASYQVGDPMVVRQVSPDRKLRIPAGFSSLAVGAGTSTTISVRPQTLFRADELVIPELFGANFTITGISIGQVSLLTGSGPVPALAFSEKSLRSCHLDFPTNQVVQEILLTVANITAAPHDIYGMFYGRAAF